MLDHQCSIFRSCVQKSGDLIAQPDMDSKADISRLGEPILLWGITGGCVDSMVANYTATKKRRGKDDYTPGGINNRRPDRAVIAYSNLVRKHFKKTIFNLLFNRCPPWLLHERYGCIKKI